jgi:hypothetical protein
MGKDLEGRNPMIKQTCPNCGQASYTANTISEATCYHCEANCPEDSYHKIGGVLKPDKTSRMTNYDRIRNMSIEEMAEEIFSLEIDEKINFCKSDCIFDLGDEIPHEYCVECLVRWLREEVKDEKAAHK